MRLLCISDVVIVFTMAVVIVVMMRRRGTDWASLASIYCSDGGCCYSDDDVRAARHRGI